MRIEINGEKPYQYSTSAYNDLTHKAYRNEYILRTGDSFEIGRAFSLHLTKRDARSYLADHWWQATSRALEIFISQSTLKRMTKSKEKHIFRSWEN